MKLTNNQFFALMSLLMTADPSPVDSICSNELQDLADSEARLRGFDGWIVAIHKVVYDCDLPIEMQEQEKDLINPSI